MALQVASSSAFVLLSEAYVARKAAVSSHQQLTCLFKSERKAMLAASVISKRRTRGSRQSSSLRIIVSADAVEEEKPTIDNSTVLVVGGGGVGMEVTRFLAKAGSWVTAFQRGEKFRPEIEQLGAMLAIGDVMMPESIEKALRTNTFDAVVCSVGGGIKDISVDSDGVINVIRAAEIAKIPRFVMVSSIGAGDSAGALSPREMEILGPVLVEKEKAEAALKASSLKWTIVRPGGLLAEAPTKTGILTEDNSVIGIITRGDVAALIASILFEEKAEGKVLSAIDPQKAFNGAQPKKVEEFSVA